MPKRKYIRGIIDPISLIGVLFLIVTLVVGTKVTNDRKISLNINEQAKKEEKTGNSAFDKCREESGREVCNERLGTNINWKGEDKTVYEQPVTPAPEAPAAIVPTSNTLEKEEIDFINKVSKEQVVVQQPKQESPVVVINNELEKEETTFINEIAQQETKQQAVVQQPIQQTVTQTQVISQPIINPIQQKEQQPTVTTVTNPINPFTNITAGVSGGTIPTAPNTYIPPPLPALPTIEKLLGTLPGLEKIDVNKININNYPVAPVTPVKPKYASRTECMAAENNNQYKCNAFTTTQETYDTLNTITSGNFGNYTQSFAPDKVKYYWQTNDYNSLEDCENNFVGRGKGYCSQIQYTKEQVTSSIDLGIALTAKGAAIAALPATLTAGSLVGGFTAGLTALGGITTLNQTGNAVVAQIEDPGSAEAWKQTGLASLSWANLGTADYLLKTFANTASTAQAINNARRLNTAVSGVNLAVDLPNAITTCKETPGILSCGGAVAAVVADVGFGTLDMFQGQTIFRDIPKIDIPVPKEVMGGITPPKILPELNGAGIANAEELALLAKTNLPDAPRPDIPIVELPAAKPIKPADVVANVDMPKALDTLSAPKKTFTELFDEKITNPIRNLLQNNNDQLANNLDKVIKEKSGSYSIENSPNYINKDTAQKIANENIHLTADGNRLAGQSASKTIIDTPDGKYLIVEIQAKSDISLVEYNTKFEEYTTSLKNGDQMLASQGYSIAPITNVEVNGKIYGVQKYIEGDPLRRANNEELLNKIANKLSDDGLAMVDLYNGNLIRGTDGKITFIDNDQVVSYVSPEEFKAKIKIENENNPDDFFAEYKNRDVETQAVDLTVTKIKKPVFTTLFGEPKTIKINDKSSGIITLKPGDTVTYGSRTIVIPDPSKSNFDLYWQLDDHKFAPPQKFTEAGIKLDLAQTDMINIGPLDNNGIIDYYLNESEWKKLFGDKFGPGPQILIQSASDVSITRANPEPGMFTIKNDDGWFPGVKELLITDPIVNPLANVSTKNLEPKVFDATGNNMPKATEITIPKKFTNWAKAEMAKTNPNAFDNLKNGFELRSPIGTDGKLQLPFEKTTVPVSEIPKDIVQTIDLVSQRPAELNASIDSSFKELNSTNVSGGHVPGYIYEGGTGINNDYKFGSVSANDIVAKKINFSSKNETVKVLDVGAGKGGYLKNIQSKYGDSVELFGLSANDYRSSENPLNGIDYTIGNAENLSQIYPKDYFDVITTNIAITHFEDPLSTVQQMYSSLKKGGIMTVDNFKLPGLEGKTRNLLEFLKGKGYQISTNLEYGFDSAGQYIDQSIDYLIIRKTVDTLDFPVTYSGINSEGKAVYKLISDIPELKITLPQATLDIFTTPDAKYSGNLKIHFEDLSNKFDADTWRSYYARIEDEQITKAINSHATPQEIADLKNVHQKIVDGTEAYYKFKGVQDQSLMKEAINVVTSPSPLTGFAKFQNDFTTWAKAEMAKTNPDAFKNINEDFSNFWKNNVGFELRSPIGTDGKLQLPFGKVTAPVPVTKVPVNVNAILPIESRFPEETRLLGKGAVVINPELTRINPANDRWLTENSKAINLQRDLEEEGSGGIVAYFDKASKDFRKIFPDTQTIPSELEARIKLQTGGEPYSINELVACQNGNPLCLETTALLHVSGAQAGYESLVVVLPPQEGEIAHAFLEFTDLKTGIEYVADPLWFDGVFPKKLAYQKYEGITGLDTSKISIFTKLVYVVPEDSPLGTQIIQRRALEAASTEMTLPPPLTGLAKVQEQVGTVVKAGFSPLKYVAGGIVSAAFLDNYFDWEFVDRAQIAWQKLTNSPISITTSLEKCRIFGEENREKFMYAYYSSGKCELLPRK